MPATVLALDVGDKRIGVAIATVDVGFPRPLTTLIHDDNFWSELQSLLTSHDVQTLVVGLPRGLDGQETEQTRKIQQFIAALQTRVTLPIVTQDEAATSVKAEAELQARGKPYEKSAIDALAATYILEDYLGELRHV